MTAVPDISPSGAAPHAIATSFTQLDLPAIQRLVEHATESIGAGCTKAQLIDRTSALESLQNSFAALQSATVLAYARAEAADQTAAGTVQPEKLERSIAGQIAYACRVSPTEGRKRVRVARDLHDGLDHLRRLFGAGEVSAYKVSTVVTATSHLDAAERAQVDQLLAGRDIAHLGVGTLRGLARQFAAQVAPEKFRTRCAAARSGRRVTLRPAADGMTDLIAHLPAEQGAACLAALHKACNDASVDPAPMTRGRGQVMADTLVERVTGQATADAVNVEVQIVIPVEALVDPDSPLPAEIPGYGPVPADLLSTLSGRKAWRRLVTRAGIVIGGDSRQRFFTGLLAKLIRARDNHRCSEPYCDAPIRHIDHIRRHADGGKTEFGNGRGVCEFHNHLREEQGWHVVRTRNGVCTTTPTGHSYTSPATRIVPGR